MIGGTPGTRSQGVEFVVGNWVGTVVPTTSSGYGAEENIHHTMGATAATTSTTKASRTVHPTILLRDLCQLR